MPLPRLSRVYFFLSRTQKSIFTANHFRFYRAQLSFSLSCNCLFLETTRRLRVFKYSELYKRAPCVQARPKIGEALSLSPSHRARYLYLPSLSFFLLEILPCTISRRVHTQRHLSAAAIIDKHRRRATREKERKNKQNARDGSLFRYISYNREISPVADPRSRYVLYRSASFGPRT